MEGNKKYTKQDLLKAIEMARDIFDGNDTFSIDDIFGYTELCTSSWKFKLSNKEIIKYING